MLLPYDTHGIKLRPSTNASVFVLKSFVLEFSFQRHPLLLTPGTGRPRNAGPRVDTSLIHLTRPLGWLFINLAFLDWYSGPALYRLYSDVIASYNTESLLEAHGILTWV